MGSLARCLKAAGLSKHEAAILRGRADSLTSAEMDQHNAALGAVRAYIGELEDERADIVRQIEEAGGRIEPVETGAKDAIREGQEPRDLGTQYQRTAQREDVREDQGEVREEKGGRSSRGDQSSDGRAVEDEVTPRAALSASAGTPDLQAAREAKASADAQAGDFALTGSDRAADANPNQGGIFAGGSAKPHDQPKTTIPETPPQGGVAVSKPPARSQYSIAREPVRFAQEVLQELAVVDEFFRYPVSQSATLEGNMADAMPGAQYLGENTRADERQESGADRRYVFKTPHGKFFYVYERGPKDVWMDVSRLAEGEQESAIYHAVANYAHNAHKRFIGDPAGLSEAAVVRRTSAMLSSALRFGTTRHLEAAPEQIAGRPDKGIAPLDWRGDDVAKTDALIHTFLSTIEARFPQLKDYRYDFAEHRFVDRRGRPVDAARLERGAGTPGGRAARAGEATLRRGIFLQSLVASPSGQKPAILEQFLRGSSALVAQGGLDRLFSTTPSTSATTGETPATIRAALAKRFGASGIKALENGGVLKIVADASRVQEGLLSEPNARALYDPETGTAYLIADRLTPTTSQVVLLHELGEHYSLRTALGPKGWNTLAMKVRLMAMREGSRARQTWSAIKENYTEFEGRTDKDLAADERFMHEMIAHLGESAAFRQSSVWRDIVAAVKRFLLKFGFSGTITEDDVGAFLDGALRQTMRAEERRQAAYAQDAAGQAQFLSDEAAKRGHKDVDEFAAKDAPGFASATERWRESHTMAARRIFSGVRTVNDFIVPETPEFEGNMSGDLAYMPDGVPGAEQLPIRMTVGDARGLHRGFGIMHIADNAKRETRRAPPRVTGDLAEDAMRHVMAILGSTSKIYDEGGVFILRSERMREAIPVVRRTDKKGDGYYGITTYLPAVKSSWGDPVWSGRLTFPDSRRSSAEPPVLSAGNLPATGPQRAEVQTEHFDLSEEEARKQGPSITFKKKRPLASVPLGLGDLNPQQREAAEHVLGSPPTVAQRARKFNQNLGKNLAQGIFDQFAPIKDLDEKAYMLARMSKGGDSTLEAALLYGKVFVDQDGFYDVDYTATRGKQGFASSMAKLKGEHDRFLLWIAAQRAERLKAVGLENLFSAQDIAALKTLNQGKMKDGTPRGPLYLKAALDLQSFNNSFLKIAKDSGLISDDTARVLSDMPYVPFYRLMEDGIVEGFGHMKPGLVNQSAWKRLKGGTEQLHEDLLANLLQNWSHLITASARNRAAKATLDAAEKAGIAQQVPAGTKGSVKYSENGVEKAFVVSDPHILDAISALEYAGLGAWAKPFTAAKRYLTMGVTVNPTFKIRNLIRDSISAIGTSDLSANPLLNVKRGWSATAKESETRAKMLASGGMIRFGSMLDGNNSARTQRLIDQGVDPAMILDSRSKIEKFWKHNILPAFEAYQEFGDRGEQVNRAALYERLRAKGMSHGEASFWARDLLDFSMTGKWTAIRTLTQVVPFMNARLQGLYKLGRATRQDWRRMAYTLGAVSLASMALMLAYEDDDDWKKRPDWDRDNYWWFKVGDTAVRIPKPFEIGAIGTLAERGLELMVSDEMNGKRFARNMRDLVSNQLSMNPMPQLVKPMMDLYANKDSFSGRPIESMGMERMRPEDRYTSRTSEVSRFLGSLGLPNPADLALGRYNELSPVQIDHLIRGYFAWVGTSALTAMDYGIRPMVDRGERPASRLRDVFLAGNFVESLPSGSSRYVDQLYQQAKEVEQAFGSYRSALKRGDKEAAAEIKEEEGENLRKYRGIETAKRDISALNLRERLIESSKTLSADEKRSQLDEIARRKDAVARRASNKALADSRI